MNCSTSGFFFRSQIIRLCTTSANYPSERVIISSTIRDIKTSILKFKSRRVVSSYNGTLISLMTLIPILRNSYDYLRAKTMMSLTKPNHFHSSTAKIGIRNII